MAPRARRAASPEAPQATQPIPRRARRPRRTTPLASAPRKGRTTTSGSRVAGAGMARGGDEQGVGAEPSLALELRGAVDQRRLAQAEVGDEDAEADRRLPGRDGDGEDGE